MPLRFSRHPPPHLDHMPSPWDRSIWAGQPPTPPPNTRYVNRSPFMEQMRTLVHRSENILGSHSVCGTAQSRLPLLLPATPAPVIDASWCWSGGGGFWGVREALPENFPCITVLGNAHAHTCTHTLIGLLPPLLPGNSVSTPTPTPPQGSLVPPCQKPPPTQAPTTAKPSCDSCKMTCHAHPH